MIAEKVYASDAGRLVGKHRLPLNAHLFREPKERCHNACCTRWVYRGKKCYRCWAGDKWTSMRRRVRGGYGDCYIGVPLGFTKSELIRWVLDNPPPDSLVTPSIDRIESELGYVPGNIQWMELRKNSRHSRKNDPDGLKLCPSCNQFLPATEEYFCRSNSPLRYSFYPLQSKCRPCKLSYDRLWREKKRVRE